MIQQTETTESKNPMTNYDLYLGIEKMKKLPANKGIGFGKVMDLAEKELGITKSKAIALESIGKNYPEILMLNSDELDPHLTLSIYKEKHGPNQFLTGADLDTLMKEGAAPIIEKFNSQGIPIPYFFEKIRLRFGEFNNPYSKHLLSAALIHYHYFVHQDIDYKKLEGRLIFDSSEQNIGFTSTQAVIIRFAQANITMPLDLLGELIYRDEFYVHLSEGDDDLGEAYLNKYHQFDTESNIERMMINYGFAPVPPNYDVETGRWLQEMWDGDLN